MRKIVAKAMFLTYVCVMAWKFSAPQTTRAAVVGGRRGDHLRLVVILSRHGIRSSTWTQERLDGYSALPWPKWSVPPGDLTSRGYEQMKQFGSYDRTVLSQAGLFKADGCVDASKTYIWADTDQRTQASGKAFAEAFFPGCPPPVHGLAIGERDPVFHSRVNEVGQATTGVASAQAARRAEPQTSAVQRELIEEMQHVLQGCAPKVACTPERAPELPLLGARVAPVRGVDDRMADSQSPLALASSFAEDLLLEYSDGMPMDQVGWGKVDEPQLRKFLTLHTEYFEQTHRSPAQARLESSTMLSQIARTLQQAVEQRPVTGAIGPANTKLVFLAGHDSNIAGVAALLGVHWSLDGRRDDTPPGTELAFELWQDERGAYSVRVTVAMQTLLQMREMQVLTPATPPANATLAMRGCDVREDECPWAGFRRIAKLATDANAVRSVHPN